MTNIGQEMINNRKLFLSRRAAYAFGGFANQQLRRLENAVARDKLSQGKREEHILGSMQNSMAAFETKYTSFPHGAIQLYTDVSAKEELDREVFADITLKHFPAREFNSMINDMTNIIGCYDKLNHRNRKKDDNHLNKHAMHLVRLYLTCFDVLEKGDIVTYRDKDLDLLRSIRRGDYQNEDGTYKQEFFDMITEYEKRLEYDKNNTGLPEHPNMKKIEEFVMDINRKVL